ncbi:GAF domain-containing sensor histidine kinase [Azospirillum sp. SYSU D00513]|uniref:GAF domain-containing sensor histidine kinase n=1 Tax=Azospirillum sp. SYSU D00513 TaxID=2812561 RepID=UPI001A9688FD|nr:GAF domain-containing sensor histidine kinase [Azospirillum sp. SYSU D00513]
MPNAVADGALADDDAGGDRFSRDLAAIARIDAIPTMLEVVCRTTGMGFAAVARVTEERWIACAVRDEIAFGLQPGGELPVETTICDEIRGSGRYVVIDHVAEDGIFCDHRTPKIYGFQSYLSMPVFRRNGEFFGTLCAIDPRPARLDKPETIGMFKLFADLIGFHLDAMDRMESGEAALLDERRTGELRDQFIAVLGHDLRNPLASIDAGMRLLRKTPLSAPAAEVVAHVQKSTARMAGLIDDVLDFARGRLGGGLPCARRAEPGLDALLDQVVAELRSAWPDRIIQCDLALGRPVHCDGARVAQLLSNLLANALTHGDPAGPVRVRGRCGEDGFELSVSNLCEPIPPEILARLFQPFARASAKPGRQGLGLGLYIASEIARAHGGRLEATSAREETRFTFRMPAHGMPATGAETAVSG